MKPNQPSTPNTITSISPHITEFPTLVNEKINDAIKTGNVAKLKEVFDDSINLKILKSNPKYEVLLMSSALYGLTKSHAEIVQYLINLGVNVNNNEATYSFLHIAASYGNLDTIRVLIQNKANINKRVNNTNEETVDDTPLMSALRLAKFHPNNTVNLEVFKEFLQNKNLKLDILKTADIGILSLVLLMPAYDSPYKEYDGFFRSFVKGINFRNISHQEKMTLAKLIFNAQTENNQLAEEDLTTAVLYTGGIHEPEFLRCLLNEKFPFEYAKISGYTFMLSAVNNNDLEALKILQEKGFDINQRDPEGLTALYNAVGKGYEQCVDYLLTQNVELTITKNISILLVALTAVGNENVLKKILSYCEKKLDKIKFQNWKDDAFSGGFATDYMSVYQSKPKTEEHIISLLSILHASNVNVNNINAITNKSALMTAAALGLTKILDWLLTLGVKIDQQNHKGETALMHAVQNGQCEAVEVLLDKGVDKAILTKNKLNAYAFTDTIKVEVNNTAVPIKERLTYTKMIMLFHKEYIDKTTVVLTEAGRQDLLGGHPAPHQLFQFLSLTNAKILENGQIKITLSNANKFILNKHKAFINKHKMKFITIDEATLIVIIDRYKKHKNAFDYSTMVDIAGNYKDQFNSNDKLKLTNIFSTFFELSAEYKKLLKESKEQKLLNNIQSEATSLISSIIFTPIQLLPSATAEANLSKTYNEIFACGESIKAILKDHLSILKTMTFNAKKEKQKGSKLVTLKARDKECSEYLRNANSEYHQIQSLKEDFLKHFQKHQYYIALARNGQTKEAEDFYKQLTEYGSKINIHKKNLTEILDNINRIKDKIEEQRDDDSRSASRKKLDDNISDQKQALEFNQLKESIDVSLKTEHEKFIEMLNNIKLKHEKMEKEKKEREDRRLRWKEELRLRKEREEFEKNKYQNKISSHTKNPLKVDSKKNLKLDSDSNSNSTSNLVLKNNSSQNNHSPILSFQRKPTRITLKSMMVWPLQLQQGIDKELESFQTTLSNLHYSETLGKDNLEELTVERNALLGLSARIMEHLKKLPNQAVIAKKDAEHFRDVIFHDQVLFPEIRSNNIKENIEKNRQIKDMALKLLTYLLNARKPASITQKPTLIESNLYHQILKQNIVQYAIPQQPRTQFNFINPTELCKLISNKILKLELTLTLLKNYKAAKGYYSQLPIIDIAIGFCYANLGTYATELKRTDYRYYQNACHAGKEYEQYRIIGRDYRHVRNFGTRAAVQRTATAVPVVMTQNENKTDTPGDSKQYNFTL